jgi:hypothetical protein
MTTSFDRVAKLSEQELLDHFTSLVARDRHTTADLLVAIAEIDDRKLWAVHACSSMFTFCMERFHMSEQVTSKRLWAARTARRFPVILEMVARGELHLGAIHLLAKHLTGQNHTRLLERARHKSCREVERLVAELAPRADVPSRIRALPGPRGVGMAVDGPAAAASEPARAMNNGTGSTVDAQAMVAAALLDGTSSREVSINSDSTGWVNDPGIPTPPRSQTAAKPIVALSPRRFKIEITVDEATHDKLRSLQDLMARCETGRDPAAIISCAIDVLLVRTLARKAACVARPKPTKPMTLANSMTSTVQPTSTMPGSAVRPAFMAPTTPASDCAPASHGHRSRKIPAAVRREVWLRDSGRCCYEDMRGRRCSETSNVEFHHKNPFALGGLPTTDNIELRCAAHNQFQAHLDFSRSFMDAKRGKSVAA